MKSTRKYHRFHYGSGRRNITLLAVFLNPCPPPELPPGLPAPRRRSCRRRGGPCVALPPYLSAGARDREDRITWRCATIRFVPDLLRAAPPDHLAKGRGKRTGEQRERDWGPAGGFRTSLDRGQWGLDRGKQKLHNSDKKFALTLGAEAEAEGRGQGWGEVQEAERGREATSPAMPE